MIVPIHDLTPPVRIDWQSGAKNLPHGFVVDLDTMKPISGPDGMCCFVDEGTGEWKRYVSGPDGRLLVESGKGRVKFFQLATRAKGPLAETKGMAMKHKATHSSAILELSEAAYREIKAKLEKAGYQHAFQNDPEKPDSPTIHLHGIAVRPIIERGNSDLAGPHTLSTE
jgi:hypothetical protein